MIINREREELISLEQIKELVRKLLGIHDIKKSSTSDYYANNTKNVIIKKYDTRWHIQLIAKKNGLILDLQDSEIKTQDQLRNLIELYMQINPLLREY